MRILMAKRFKTPSLRRLAEVDVSGATFNKECVDIEGVVCPSGHGGWDGTGDYRVHCFSLAAWRRVGGPLVSKRLIVLRPAPNHDWSGYPVLSIHRLRVLLSTDETRCVVAKRLPAPRDAKELVKAAKHLSRPLFISTRRFGELYLDRQFDWFCGEAKWNGKPVEIQIDANGTESVEHNLPTAEALWKDQASWKRKVENYAVKELLPIKNRHWLDDDEKPLTAKQFKSRMQLGSIQIHKDGEFEFWHDDGDMFLGHSIQVCGLLKKGFTKADIPG